MNYTLLLFALNNQKRKVTLIIYTFFYLLKQKHTTDESCEWETNLKCI